MPTTPEIAFQQMTEAYRALDALWLAADAETRVALVTMAQSRDQNNSTWEEYGAAHHILFLANRAGMVSGQASKSVSQWVGKTGALPVPITPLPITPILSCGQRGEGEGKLI